MGSLLCSAPQLAADGFNKGAGAFLQRQDQEAEGAEAGTDAEGNTHLHLLARENGSPELVRGMAESMDINKENKNQDTPLHLAAKAGHVEVRPASNGSIEVLAEGNWCCPQRSASRDS